MLKFLRLATIMTLALSITSCNFPGLTSTTTESEPQPESPTITEAGPLPIRPTRTEPAAITTAPPDIDTPMPSICTLNAINDAPAYFRPSTESNVFGTFSAGMNVEAIARTPDGWIGFEPGVAQAANVGIFRLRWVKETSDISLDGDCGALPIVQGPAPGICFAMLLGDTSVYEEPDPASNLVVTLTTQDYAAVTGRSPDDWYRLDLAIGDTSSNRAGWAEGATISLNGPCNSLPIINIPAGQALTTAGGSCTLTADADIAVTARPFPISDVFGTLSSGMSVSAMVQTPNGFIGFEPGVAQAANVDIFRLRWIDPDAPFTLAGSCGGLPTVIGPPPFVCFNMAMTDIQVYADSDPSSPVIATLYAEEYAAVTAKTPTNWYRIDLGFGNSLSNEAGWMEGTLINMSGHCDDLPIVAP